MIAAIIQARTGSSRLPGKIVKQIEGKTLLEHMIERVGRARTLDKIVVATTEKPEDDVIADIALKLGVGIFRGAEDDVLNRYHRAAEKFSATHIVRLTGDCPLIDPAVIDAVVDFYLEGQPKYDYVSNAHPPTYPNGMDAEVFSRASLERAHADARLRSEREHVTPYIANHPEIFRQGNVAYGRDMSSIRITVDNPEDFTVICNVFKALYPGNKEFGLEDILDLWQKTPEAFSANRHIKRNEGYAKSLAEDRTAVTE